MPLLPSTVAPTVTVAPAAGRILIPIDILPEGPSSGASLEQSAGVATSSTLGTLPSPAPLAKATIYRTSPNAFGVYREYATEPLKIPDIGLSSRDLCADGLDELLRRQEDQSQDPKELKIAELLYPFENISQFRLHEWYHQCGGTVSHEKLSALVRDVMLAPDYHPSHLEGWSVEKVEARLKKLDEEMTKDPDRFPISEGWHTQSVNIDIPTGVKANARTAGEPASRRYEIDGLHRRSIIDLIKGSLFRTESEGFHYEPYKSFRWHPRSDSTTQAGSRTGRTRAGVTPLPTAQATSERIYDELYASDAWIEEHAKLQSSAAEPECTLPRAIAGLMFGSDATHLTQFGSKKMWPIYLFFGNQTKYDRCRPSTHSCHHLAHIPSVCNFNYVDAFSEYEGMLIAPPISSSRMTSRTSSVQQLGRVARPHSLHIASESSSRGCGPYF